MGDFSSNGIFTFTATYLMFFYTDVAKIGLGAIGVILLLGRIVDAVCSPVMGVIVDRTNTRYGKCKPFLAVGIVPVCILLTLLFYSSDGMPAGMKVAFAAVTYVLFSILYAFMNVPYSTMINVLTKDNEQRIAFNLFKNVGANCGGIFVTACTLWMVTAFGSEVNQGFTKTVLVFGAVFLMCTLLCVRNTKERVKDKGKDHVNVRASFRIAAQNKPWLLLCGVQFLGMTYMMVRNQGTIYYAKYYLGREELSSLLLSIMPFASILVAFILPTFAKKWGMRGCVRTGNILWCIAMAGTWMAGENIVLVIFFHILASVGWAVATGMVFVMLSQTIDYAQWKTGIRPQGFLTAMIAFVQKLGIACSGFICALVLELGGYRADQIAGSDTLFAIRMNFSGLPLILSAAVILLISFYDLDNKYPEIERELNMSDGKDRRKK